MKYKEQLWLVLWAFCMTAMACQSMNKVSSIHAYQEGTAPKIDGVLQEWASPLSQAKDYNVFQYNLGHDKDYLYVGIRISDRGMQQRVMALGMTVYTDTTGKRKEKIGVVYPLPLTEKQINKAAFEASKEGSFDKTVFNEAYAKIAQEFELIGFVEEDPKERIRVSNLASKELKTAMGFDQLGAMIIEYRIPFSQLYNRPINYKEVISLGLKINAPQPNADDDTGLFNDVANPITSSGQQNNALFQNNPQRGLQQPQQPRVRRNSNASLGTWEKIQLNALP